jgi:N,N'-diacetyllegionaminate synthase
MESVLIIAEAGVNHNGSLTLAMKMVDEAKNAGADIIKFQTAKPELVISKYAEKAEYQKNATGTEESQLEMCKKIHLKFEDYIPIKKHCEEVGIKFLSTPFDLDSIDFLEELGCDLWKIPSGEITNYPYLVKIAKTRKPIILSTGMCNINDIRKAIELLNDNGAGEITLLHCTTEYPAPYGDVNLNAMETLRREFGLKVGYSDHTKGITIPIAAAAMGATVIEKHFTLDRNMEGPDHKASLEPDELSDMVNAVRCVEVAMGSGIKEPAESEIKNMAIARKSIVAKRDIKRGEPYTEDNITTKRPGNGISPMRWNEVLGMIANRDYGEDELIKL